MFFRHHRIIQLVVFVIELDDRARQRRAFFQPETGRERPRSNIAHYNFKRNNLDFADQLLPHIQPSNKMRRHADRVQLQKNIFRDAIVQHALAIKHGVFLGIERGCIIFEMLHERTRLRTLIKDLRLALINPTAAIHRHIPWFEKIHKRTNASRRPLPLPERRCLMALKRQNIIHRQNHSIRSYRRAQ